MKLNISKQRTFSQIHKGAFIIYPEGRGGYDDFEGVTLFPYYDLGGAWKNSNGNDTEHGGANHFFF